MASSHGIFCGRGARAIEYVYCTMRSDDLTLALLSYHCYNDLLLHIIRRYTVHDNFEKTLEETEIQV